MATTSNTPFHIAAAALILMCVGAAAQAPASSPSKRIAPGPSSHVGKAPEPSSSVGKAPEPSSYEGMAPEPSSYGGMTPETMAPSPAGEQCFNYLLNMSGCLSYVQDGSNQTVPDKPCCPELAGLLDSHPLCLCEFVGAAASYGVNVSKALTLPGACNIAAPPLTLCPGFAGPEPAGSPPEPSKGPAAGGPGPAAGGPGPAAGGPGPAAGGPEPPKALATSTMADSSLAFLLVLIALF